MYNIFQYRVPNLLEFSIFDEIYITGITKGSDNYEKSRTASDCSYRGSICFSKRIFL